MKKLLTLALSVMMVLALASICMAGNVDTDLNYWAGGSFDASGSDYSQGKIFRAKAYDETNVRFEGTNNDEGYQNDLAMSSSGKKVQSRGIATAEGENPSARLRIYGHVDQATMSATDANVYNGMGGADAQGFASQGSAAGYDGETEGTGSPSWTDRIHMHHKGDAQSYGASVSESSAEVDEMGAQSSMYAVTEGKSAYGDVDENPQQVTAYRNNGSLDGNAYTWGEGNVNGQTHAASGLGNAWTDGGASYSYGSNQEVHEQAGSGSSGKASSFKSGFAETEGYSRVTRSPDGDISVEASQSSVAGGDATMTEVEGSAHIDSNPEVR